MTPNATPPAARVRLLTRTECHLCDVARTVLVQVCGAADEEWDEVNVDSDAQLRSEFGDQVPVVLVDDEVVATLTVEPSILQQALKH